MYYLLFTTASSDEILSKGSTKRFVQGLAKAASSRHEISHPLIIIWNVVYAFISLVIYVRSFSSPVNIG